MRHLHVGRKLNRTASHRKAMLGNLAVSILDKERVVTTIAKAKEVRRVVERLITYGKRGSLHGIRLAARTVKDKRIVTKLFEDIAPSYKDRAGGYVRILRLEERRGDNALMVIVELVGRSGQTQRKKKKSRAARRAAKELAAEQEATVEATTDAKEETVETPVEEAVESTEKTPKKASAKEESKEVKAPKKKAAKKKPKSDEAGAKKPEKKAAKPRASKKKDESKGKDK